MHRKPDFELLRGRWSHADASRFVTANGLRFHYQEIGAGSPILILHGTGASTHSFRDMMSILAQEFRVVAVDLPGHGFTDTPPLPDMTLEKVAAAMIAFLDAANIEAPAIVAHSAGVAVAIQMALAAPARVGPVVGFNGSLKPYAGAAAPIFSAMARVLFINPMTPRLFAATASKGRVKQLIEGTGSTIAQDGLFFYQTLFRSTGHVHGALSMMAALDLAPLQRRLREVRTPVTLVAAAQDRAVSPMISAEAARKIPGGSLVRVGRLGHLAHEEDPAGGARIVVDALKTAG